jgi:hypothetical protein
MNLVKIYGQAERELKAEISAIDLLEFNAEKAEAIRRRVLRLTLGLDLAAKRWTGKDLMDAYVLGGRRARVALEILGKKPKRQPMDKKGALRDDALETLVKANHSIRGTIDEVLEAALVGAHTMRSARIQEFNWREAYRRFTEWGEEAVIEEISRGELGKKIFDYLLGQIDDNGFIRIKGRYWNPRKYTELVARTELRKAQTEATKDLCREYENDLVQWSDHATDCEICEQFEGKIYSLSGHDPKYPMLPEEPPAHPNCLLPGNRLISPGGFVAGIRARYGGEAVELTFAQSGNLTVTANHMLLTPFGFASAKSLCKGDDIFYCPEFQGIVSGYPYNNGTPSLIEKIIHALSESVSMATRRMPVAPEDIHGDGRFCNGDIDIISANGLLRDTRKALFFQHGQALPFYPGDPEAPLFPGEGDLVSMLWRLALAADGIMGGLRVPNSLISGHARTLDTLNITVGTRLNTRLMNDSADGHPSNAQSFSDINEQQSGLIESDGLGRVELPTMLPGQENPFLSGSPRDAQSNQPFADGFWAYAKLISDLTRRQPGMIKPDKLIDIRIFNYSGHVYDLQSSTSLYLVNGIISSNCKHSLLPTSVEAIAARRRWS